MVLVWPVVYAVVMVRLLRAPKETARRTIGEVMMAYMCVILVFFGVFIAISTIAVGLYLIDPGTFTIHRR